MRVAIAFVLIVPAPSSQCHHRHQSQFLCLQAACRTPPDLVVALLLALPSMQWLLGALFHSVKAHFLPSHTRAPRAPCEILVGYASQRLTLHSDLMSRSDLLMGGRFRNELFHQLRKAYVQLRECRIRPNLDASKGFCVCLCWTGFVLFVCFVCCFVILCFVWLLLLCWSLCCLFVAFFLLLLRFFCASVALILFCFFDLALILLHSICFVSFSMFPISFSFFCSMCFLCFCQFL